MISNILAIVSNLILLVIGKIGYAGVLLLMVLQSFNIPVPSEITMSFSGFLASQNIFNFWAIVFFGAIGNLFGSFLSYKLAHFLVEDGLRENSKFLKF